MTLLPSQVERIRSRLEIAVDADLDDPTSWVWTDISDRDTVGSRTQLLSSSTSLPRGRADQSSDTQPSAASFEVDNPDGALTPDKADSLWYPAWDVGTPCRFSIYAGSPYVAFSGAAGSRIGTGDTATLDILADWTVIVELWPPIWVPPDGVNYELAGKFNTTGNQRSLLMWLDADALLRLRWSTNGTAAGELDSLSSEPIPLPEAGPLTLVAWLDVNNGAAGRTTHFYACLGERDDFLADPDAFVLGDPDTDAGTTSVFASTATLDAGDVTGSGFSPYPGNLRRLQVRAGDPFTGDVRANPDITLLDPGATTLTDSEGLVWTVQGTAEVTDAQPLLTGQVDEIYPSWPYGDLSNGDDPGEARVDITVSGILRRLSQGQKPLQSTLFRTITSEINAAAVHAYWSGEDGKDSLVAASPIDGVRAGVIRMDYATDDTLPASKPLPKSSSTFGWAFPIPATVPTTGWQITWLLRIDTPEISPASTTINMIDATGTVERWRLRISNDNVNLRAFDVNEVSLLDDNTTIDSRCFDTWMIVTLSIAQVGGNVTWDLDLIPIPLGLVFGDSGTINSQTCGRPTRIHTPTLTTAPPDGISAGHWIVTTDRASGWLAPADTAYDGEPATSRFVRLCEEAGIPVTVFGPTGTDWDAVASAGVVRMGPQLPVQFLDLLRECVAADMGMMSEHRHQLGLHYRARVTLQNQTPKLILDAAADEIANPLAPARDDRARINDVTASRPNGSSARVTTDPPPAPGDLYDVDVPVNVASDLQLPGQANWRLHLGTWKGMRYPSLSVEATVAPRLFDELLGLQLGDRVQVINLPPQHPVDAVDVLIEGEGTVISPIRWMAQYGCSPYLPWEVGVRDDDERGKRDTSGSELGSGVDDNDTSWTVTTTQGPRWTTAAGEFPFDWFVGGEKVTVTAISGAGLSQTATVVRSVNGVVKSHAAGTAIRLWRPSIRAL